MRARFVPSKALELALLTGVRLGIEAQPIDRNDHSMSDDEIFLHLAKLGIETRSPVRDAAFFREAARIKAYMRFLRWERLYLEGVADHASPLRFSRTLGPLSVSQKLELLYWYQNYLVEAMQALDRSGPQYAETLQFSRLYRRHCQKFLKVKRK